MPILVTIRAPNDKITLMEKRTLSKKKLLTFLTELEAWQRDCLSIYLNSSSFPLDTTGPDSEFYFSSGKVQAALGSQAVLQEAKRYGTSVILFWKDEENRHIVLPPFPVSENKVFQGRIEISPLLQLIEKDRIVWVVLVTWNSYAIGVFNGDKLIKSKIGTGYIHKRHRKGGRSEKRFARRTEEQKKDFLRKVANRIEDTFSGYRPEYVFFGGNRLILKPLTEQCPYLKLEGQQISKRLLNIRHADKEALFGSIENVYMSTIFSD